MDKIIFKDLEGTTICAGDEVIVTCNKYGTTTAGMFKSKVIMMRNSRMYFISRMGGEAWMQSDGTPSRVLIIKGEMKTYTATEKK
jgi:hypothetical protein